MKCAKFDSVQHINVICQ